MIFIDETEYGYGEEYDKLPRTRRIINFFLNNAHSFLDDGLMTVVTDIFIETFEDNTIDPYFHSSLLLKIKKEEDKAILKFISTYSEKGYGEEIVLNYKTLFKEIVELDNIDKLEKAYLSAKEKFKLEGKKQFKI